MTVVPDAVQTFGVMVLNDTGKPELAVAATVNGVMLYTCVGNVGKLIVCVLISVIDCVTSVAAT